MHNDPVSGREMPKEVARRRPPRSRWFGNASGRQFALPRAGWMVALACCILPLWGCSGGGNSAGPTMAERIAKAQQRTDAASRARELLGIAFVQLKAQDLGGADATLVLAATACAEVAEPIGRASVYSLLAKARATAGNQSAAKEAVKIAKESCDQIADSEARAGALASLSGARTMVGDTSGANEFLRQAEEQAQRVESDEGKVRALCAVASRYAQPSSNAETTRLAEMALEVAKSASSARERSRSLGVVGALLHSTSHADRAREVLELSLVAARAVEEPFSRVYALADVAKQYIGAQQNAAAEQALDEARAIVKSIKESDLQSQAEEQINRVSGELRAE